MLSVVVVVAAVAVVVCRRRRRRSYCGSYDTPLLCDVGYVDDVIEPRETRRRLCLDLETLSTKNQSNPWKKHGNMPL